MSVVYYYTSVYYFTKGTVWIVDATEWNDELPLKYTRTLACRSTCDGWTGSHGMHYFENVVFIIDHMLNVRRSVRNCKKVWTCLIANAIDEDRPDRYLGLVSEKIKTESVY